ncbi:response regulator [Thermodesulfobacteriota bacterium]
MQLGTRILIVDDEPRMCDSLEILLGPDRYEIHKATSGHGAIENLDRNIFDLVLLDMVMPDMDGYQVLEHLDQQDHDTLVIIITGHASIESAVKALRRGAYDYVRKPFEPEELVTKVENALNQQRLTFENRLINGKLALSEQRYRYLVDNSPDIIYTLDDQGNFTFLSDAVVQLLGFESNRLLGKHYSGIIHDKDLERAKWFFSERRTGGRAASGIELRLKVNETDEQFKHCEVRHLTFELKSTGMYDKSPKEKDKKYLGTHGVVRDISGRKKLENQLQHAQRMESLGTLAGGIAHDFNNLLMGIQGNASLMLLDLESNQALKERIKSIEESVRNGADLTRQLLGFARGGKYEVKPTTLNELIIQSAEMFGRTKKEITIHKKLQEDLWTVDVDQGQIEQMLLNLYVNAWQAMPAGGELFLETENMTFSSDQVRPYQLEPGDFVKVSVTDTGVGMDDLTLQRIFEPFFTTKEMGRGTGLGLASVYGIVNNHGGVIQVESKKGAGSTFRIYIPASGRKFVEKKEMPQEVLRGSGTVLLVDDEDMVMRVGEQMLTRLGYDVLMARGGREAIESYGRNHNKIDFIILDMIMPDISGSETYDMIKEINPNAKVILSSGYSLSGQASEILERGCDGFIQKPFNLKDLSHKIREVLDRC